MQGSYIKVAICPKCNIFNRLQDGCCAYCNTSLSNASEKLIEYQQGKNIAWDYNNQQPDIPRKNLKEKIYEHKIISEKLNANKEWIPRKISDKAEGEMIMSNDSNEIISKRLKELLAEYNLTTSQFADSIGVSNDIALGYINGEKEVGTSTIYTISKKFNVSQAWILGVSNDKAMSKDVAPQPVENKKLTVGVYIGIIASIVTLIGIFMPFETVNAFFYRGSKSMWDYLTESEGYFELFLFVLGGVGGIVYSIKKKSKFVTLIGLAMLFFVVYFAFVGLSYNGDLNPEYVSAVTSYGAGFYFVLIGTIAMVVSGVIIGKEDRG